MFDSILADLKYKVSQQQSRAQKGIRENSSDHCKICVSEKFLIKNLWNKKKKKEKK